MVCVGASAGGLKAFKQFLGAMPSDSGLAFILTPHQAPQHESLLAGLLARHTAMPVLEIHDGMAVEANHVYVIPPNKYLAIRDRTLRLSGPVGRHDAATPIDVFLESLAVEQCERAMCVVLSGSAPYGIQGLKAINAAGGIVVVQEPVTAEYDRMPKAAIAAELADFVLPIEQMPATLVNYSRRLRITPPQKTHSGDEYGDDLDRILALLRTHMKRDYRCDRESMLVRREIGRLAKDLMVGVTGFFLEPEAFRELAARAIVDLAARQASDTAIRVWVPGCATGEEAYSIAMLVLERLAPARKACSLKIFASDIDEQALAFARQGVYHDKLRADVGGERLERFFTRLDEHTWQIGQQLREAVVFARHDLLADAPFSKLDLISCRNLLIYLEPAVRPQAVALLHFALNEGGTLLLGPSETIAGQTDLFEPLNKKWRIYRRLATARRERVVFPIVRSVERPSATARSAGLPPLPDGLVKLVRRELLAEYAPAAVVIDRQNQVLVFQGSTALYLEQPVGEPSHDLLSLARSGLRSKLRAAIHRAAREERPAVLDGARVRREGQWCSVRVGVKPLAAPRGAEGLLLVTFEDQPHSPPAGGGTETIAGETLSRPLEEELNTAREELQIAQEEMTTSHEELRLVNEEVMSMNEELQCTNEELETSKEQLQSLNEELSSSNEQLKEKVEELKTANRDVANLLHGSRQRTSTIVDTVLEGIVIIDERGKVEMFNRSAERIFGYAADEIVGRDARMLLPPPNQRVLDRHLAQSTSGESIQGDQREISARRKDGSRFALELSLSEMRDGPSRHHIAVLRDISDRKTLEKEVLEIAAREQWRIGQDLHDGASQALTGMGLLAHDLVEKLGAKSAREAALATKIAEGIKATVQEIRGIVRGLVPVEVGRDGLMAALNQLAIQTSALPRVGCTFECPRPVDVTDNFLATHIYRIAQEAVANAIKHGHARQIGISLSDDGAELKLEIDDDGSGMKRGTDEGQGMGLRLMRYRAGLIGGICSIGPAEAGGTRVVCVVARS